MTVHFEDIEYTSNGLRLVGRLIVDDSHDRIRPAILIAHEGTGLSDHVKHVAQKLAELGYVAFALDYYGDGRALLPNEFRARFAELSSDPILTRSIGQAGLDVLLSCKYTDSNSVAAIGYCFGGTMALELARGGCAIKAVVGFHSGLQTRHPEDAINITGRVLVCIGADDPIIPPEERLAFENEMREGNVEWRMNIYGGAAHSFTNPAADGSTPGVIYNVAADTQSWRAMLDLFADTFE